MSHGHTMRRLQSSLFAACLLLLGIAGSWHSHEIASPHVHGPSFDAPDLHAQEKSICVACALGHHVTAEVRSVTVAILTAQAEGPVHPFSEVAQATPTPTDPSRAPPVTL